jgi:hypothetical protein
MWEVTTHDEQFEGRIMFHRDCGATADFNTQIGLRDHERDFDPEASTLTMHHKAVSNSYGS